MSSKTIFRVATPQGRFTTYVNELAQNWDLTADEYATIMRILTLPSNWAFNMEWFVKKSGYGRNKAYRIIKDLIAKNFCKREDIRRRDGTKVCICYAFTMVPGEFEESDQLPLFGEVDARPIKSITCGGGDQLPQNGACPLPPQQDLAEQDLAGGTLQKTNTYKKQKKTKHDVNARARAPDDVIEDSSSEEKGKKGKLYAFDELMPSADALHEAREILGEWFSEKLEDYLVTDFRKIWACKTIWEGATIDSCWIGHVKQYLKNKKGEKPRYRRFEESKPEEPTATVPINSAHGKLWMDFIAKKAPGMVEGIVARGVLKVPLTTPEEFEAASYETVENKRTAEVPA